MNVDRYKNFLTKLMATKELGVNDLDEETEILMYMIRREMGKDVPVPKAIDLMGSIYEVNGLPMICRSVNTKAANPENAYAGMLVTLHMESQ